MIVLNGAFERSCNGFLPHNRIKGLWPVFSGRNNKFRHDAKIANLSGKGEVVENLILGCLMIDC